MQNVHKVDGCFWNYGKTKKKMLTSFILLKIVLIYLLINHSIGIWKEKAISGPLFTGSVSELNTLVKQFLQSSFWVSSVAVVKAYSLCCTEFSLFYRYTAFLNLLIPNISCRFQNNVNVPLKKHITSCRCSSCRKRKTPPWASEVLCRMQELRICKIFFCCCFF